jgi:ubiquinone/menaquinone biosynthesis C-methylase UbiE
MRLVEINDKKVDTTASEKLMSKATLATDKIKSVNKIYHDFEAEIYSEYHPEIDYEKTKWEGIGEKYFRQDRQITVLDVGTGNGFVPSVVGKYLKDEDCLICSDISKNMLLKAEEALNAYSRFKKVFIEADALMLSKMSIEADIVTMNSVLHHLPDYEEVLKNLAKLVKEGGLFVIMHERNQRFCRNVPFLMKQCLLAITANRLARRAAGKVLSALGLYRRKGARKDLYTKVSEAVKGQGIADRLLSTEEINGLVDFHDPDEGGEGFDPFMLQRDFFGNFEIVELFTDKHLGPWTSAGSNPVKKYLLKVLETKFPYSGAVFGLIMKKRCAA